ncbi:flagellar basal body protein [Vibrio campbellii]
MSFSDVYQIAGSAMTAQTTRLNTIASNLANANSGSTTEAETYRARKPVFATVYEQHQQSLLARNRAFQQVPVCRFLMSSIPTVS